MPHSEDDKDLYLKMMELERELEYMTMQEEVLRDEQRHLQSEYIRSKEEIKSIQATYLDTSNFVEMIDGDYAITGSASSGKYVRVLSTLDRE
jgi:26S proteasome regulatory subunit T3